MRRGIRGTVLGCLIAAACAWGVGATWQADFTPSTYNPEVNEVVAFAACEECTGDEPGLRYIWDFNNDGVVDEETGSPTTWRAFGAAAFYEVKLTVRDSVGRETTRIKGIIAGPVPVYGVRRIVLQSDGSYLVVVSIVVCGANAGFNLVESIPLGWSPIPGDAPGAFLPPYWDAKLQEFQVSWLNLDPGTEFEFSYILTRNYSSAAQRPSLSGAIRGYGKNAFNRAVGGELAVI